MSSTGSAIVDDLLDSTVGRVKRAYRKYTGGEKEEAKEQAKGADEGMVKEANESFRKAAQTKASANPKLGSTKKTARKKGQRKRAAK
ncbi:MAG TPA: hypothetical protein VN666_21900 [Nitrospira sp.]|nr:hypothetical protein [Nitrospira sp.]